MVVIFCILSKLLIKYAIGRDLIPKPASDTINYVMRLLAIPREGVVTLLYTRAGIPKALFSRVS